MFGVGYLGVLVKKNSLQQCSRKKERKTERKRESPGCESPPAERRNVFGISTRETIPCYLNVFGVMRGSTFIATLRGNYCFGDDAFSLSRLWIYKLTGKKGEEISSSG